MWLRGPLTRPELKRLLAAPADAGVRSPIALDVPPPVPQGCEMRWLNRSTLHRLWSPLALDVPPRSVALLAHALAREPGAGDHLLLPGWLDEAAELERLRDGVHDQAALAAW